ncbi:MAG: fimbrial protein [Acidovorax sp.]|jgi:type 1 fimbria pilin|nr:fimbrial protein [Acidovorax sp.]
MTKSLFKFNIKFIALFLAIIFATLNANAQNACYRYSPLSSNGWTMKPAGSSFTNGEVIGTTRASTTYYMPLGQNSSAITAGSLNAQQNAWDAIPMQQTPGVGVRVKWGGYTATTSISIVQMSPIGSSITKKIWETFLRSRASSSYYITYHYIYEIVIIDKEKYKGGKLIISDTTPVTAIASSEISATHYQTCVNGFLNLLTAVTSELNIPELPEPAKPTCASAQIGFTAKMNPINASQIAAFGSNRNQGIPGELKFRLIGNNCAKGTVIKAYFTDTRASSAENNFLYSTNETVGVRLYYDEDQDPIKMGPAPVGSTLPLRSPIIEGPAMSDNSSLYIPITAQYVRLPYVGANDVKAGGMRAATTVTFIYD